MLTILTAQKGKGQLKTTTEPIVLNYRDRYCCVFKKRKEEKRQVKVNSQNKRVDFLFFIKEVFSIMDGVCLGNIAKLTNL